MSLAELARGALRPCRATLGEEYLTISGGSPILCAPGEVIHGRDYQSGGQQQAVGTAVVAETGDFQTAYPLGPGEYLGKTATLGAESFRVDQISDGAGFTTIMLVGGEEAP